ncbi:putative ATPase [Pseudoduganella flava]|uniref:Putative ATPase n=1 Tax=Pseudoduganella flava TaxID=871742 RepID=A0A562Q3M6_9BURK|nr:tetratricopeptide repeat protein [Pseudoduganella flava]QGZ41406.1 tetratricopeptide repeat protein [Pseudoduganella flava]TWI51359.1 putative ATPase [Pseudoduganella flava]
MHEQTAKIYHVDGREHLGTAWLVAEDYALTAWHCVAGTAGANGAADRVRFRLVFDSGATALAVVHEYCPRIDAALLSLLDNKVPTNGALLFGTVPAEVRLQARPASYGRWDSYGYPSGRPQGMGIGGTVRLAEMAHTSDIQLTCDEGGFDRLDGMSGAWVRHQGYIVGIVRAAPESYREKVILATSMRAIQQALPTVGRIVERQFNDAVETVAPNLLMAHCSQQGGLVNRTDAGEHSRLLGRKLALLELNDLMAAGTQVLTLTGPAGAGKTRLALALGEVAGAPWGTAYYTDLGAGLEAPDALAEVAAVLGLREAHGQMLEESTAVEIGERAVLLIIRGAAQLALARDAFERLQRACPKLRIVATGEQPLGWPGERVYAVPPLAVPPSAATLDELARSPVLRLFEDRVRMVQPKFRLDAANARTAAQLCARLDGLPLAIELVAGLAAELLGPAPDDEQLWDVQAALRKLGALPPEQRLDAVIALAAAHLDRDTRLLLCRLAAFVGTFTLEAAEAIAGDKCGPPCDVAAKVQALANRYLITCVQRGQGRAGYRLQSAVRGHGRRCLVETEQLASVQREHARYYAQLAGKTDRRQMLLSSHELREWLELLELEHDNLRAAVAWPGSTDPAIGEPGVHIVGNLFWFWNLRGSLAEGRQWVDEMLRAEPADKEAHALALYCRGGLAFLQGDYPAARADLERSAHLWKVLDNERRLGFTLVILGMVALHQNRIEEAMRHELASIALFNATDERAGLALAQNDLANVLLERRDFDEADALYRKSLDLWQQLGNRWGMGLTTANRGHLACLRGRHDDAGMWLLDAMQLQKGGRYQWGFAQSIKFLAFVMLAQGNLCTAASLFYDSLVLHNRLGRRQLVADCLDGLAEVAMKLDEPLPAAHLFGAADTIRAQCGVFLPRPWKDTREARLATLRTGALVQHAPEAFEHALQLGQRMDLATAVRTAAAYALRVSGAG